MQGRGNSACKTQDLWDADVSVILCRMDDMGHCWHGQPTCIDGTPNIDMVADGMMWAVFRHSLLP